jgi:hypothetical protein
MANRFGPQRPCGNACLRPFTASGLNDRGSVQLDAEVQWRSANSQNNLVPIRNSAAISSDPRAQCQLPSPNSASAGTVVRKATGRTNVNSTLRRLLKKQEIAGLLAAS